EGRGVEWNELADPRCAGQAVAYLAGARLRVGHRRLGDEEAKAKIAAGSLYARSDTLANVDHTLEDVVLQRRGRGAIRRVRQRRGHDAHLAAARSSAGEHRDPGLAEPQRVGRD